MTFDFAGPIAYASFFLVFALLNALVCLGLNVQWGQAGLFNVGVAGFVAIGAYASALLTTPPSESHLGGFALPIPVGWLAAMAFSGAASAAIGALTLRLRADYLAITTFGVAVIVQLVALNAQALTGGAFGVAFIPRPFDSLAATPALYDLANLALIAPENYTSGLTFQVWTMLIVGGSGNNLGAIIGAGLVWALWTISGLAIADLVPAAFEARAAALRIVAIGVLLATMIILRPRGLIGEKATVSRHLD
jgi:ABC-type branched-subunit amino acid transport system permease subunit